MLDDSGILKSLLPEKLVSILSQMPFMAVALSGGVDSRFLCHAARICGCDVLAIHANGPHISATESGFAREWAKRQNLSLLETTYDPLVFQEVAQNNPMRCLVCKRGLLAKFAALCTKGADSDGKRRTLCDGGNAGDLHKFRPGLKAVAEAGVLSPLAMAGLDKPEIRRIATATGMERPLQKARPCLLTRHAYGMSTNRDMLQSLAAAEDELAALFAESAPEGQTPDFRLRLLPQAALHVDTPLGKSRARVLAILEAHGFRDCSIEILPSVSGYFDKKAGYSGASH